MAPRILQKYTSDSGVWTFRIPLHFRSSDTRLHIISSIFRIEDISLEKTKQFSVVKLIGVVGVKPRHPRDDAGLESHRPSIQMQNDFFKLTEIQLLKTSGASRRGGHKAGACKRVAAQWLNNTGGMGAWERS